MKKYQLYNLTTKEVLSDYLPFEEIPELYGAYAEFFPDNEFIVIEKDETVIKVCAKVIDKDDARRTEFMVSWLDLVTELTRIGNLY